MTPLRSFLARLLPALSVLLQASAANGYVRTTTGKTNLPIFWDNTCISLDLYVDELPEPLVQDDVVAMMEEAARAWSQDRIACSGLSFAFATVPAARGPVGYDGVNSLMFVKERWTCTPGGDTPCFDASALAVTTVTFSHATGVIKDADVLINADTTLSRPISWANVTATPNQLRAQDLQNALTHEMGHLIGLEHNCTNPGSEPLIDQTGSPAPACSSPELPPALRQATMFASAQAGEANKRTLEADDVEAVCTIYPAATRRCMAPLPKSNALVGGCSTTPGRLRTSMGTIVAAALLQCCVAGTRRIRRRQRSSL